jgi:hypothetical protein
MSRSVYLPLAKRYMLYDSLSNKSQRGSECQGVVIASSLLDMIVLLLTLLAADLSQP